MAVHLGYVVDFTCADMFASNSLSVINQIALLVYIRFTYYRYCIA